MSVDLIMYKYVSSCKIATCEGSMSINGTMQVSFGGGRSLFTLTKTGVPVGYSGSGNHFTWAT